MIIAHKDDVEKVKTSKAFAKAKTEGLNERKSKHRIKVVTVKLLRN